MKKAIISAIGLALMSAGTTVGNAATFEANYAYKDETEKRDLDTQSAGESFGGSTTHSITDSEGALSIQFPHDLFENGGFSDNYSFGVEDKEETAITVRGTGVVAVSPDHSDITLTVQETDTDEQTAKQKLIIKVSGMIDEIRDKGIRFLDSEHVTASAISVTPLVATIDGVEEKNGYEATTEIYIKECPIENVDALLSLMEETGVYGVSKISAYTDEYGEKYQDALADAVEDARNKAKAIAKAAGLEIIDIGSIDSVANNEGMSEPMSIEFGDGGEWDLNRINDIHITAQVDIVFFAR